MGKVFSYLKRPFINYAVEERAYRLLDKNEKTKPTPHPLYPTEENVLKKIQQEHPELLGQIKAKSEKLDDYLKQVKVKSTIEKVLPKTNSSTPVLEERSDDKARFPKDRLSHEGTKFGLPDLPDDKIPRGKISLRQAMDILGRIKNDSDLTEAEKLAADYKLNVDKTKSMLQYFRPFLIAGDPVVRKPEPKVPLTEAFEDAYERKLAHDRATLESKAKMAYQLNDLSKKSEHENAKKTDDLSFENKLIDDYKTSKNR